MVSTWSPGSHGWLLRIFTLSFCPALGLGFLRYDQTDTWWAFQPWYCFWISVYIMSWCSSFGFLKVLQSHCQKRCSSRTTARDNLLVPGEYFAWWEDSFDGFQALICFWDGWLRVFIWLEYLVWGKLERNIIPVDVYGFNVSCLLSSCASTWNSTSIHLFARVVRYQSNLEWKFCNSYWTHTAYQFSYALFSCIKV